MADTHPNAYRAEIAEKRKASADLAAEADALQEQLYVLTGDDADNPKPKKEPEKKADDPKEPEKVVEAKSDSKRVEHFPDRNVK